jgi:hypothetical protein
LQAPLMQRHMLPEGEQKVAELDRPGE